MQASDRASVSREPIPSGLAAASATYARAARAAAHYITPQEWDLAIANLIWMSAHAPTHLQQVDCRMMLLAMRSLGSEGPAVRA